MLPSVVFLVRDAPLGKAQLREPFLEVVILFLCVCTVRVKIITGSLVTPENLFPQNYRYRYRLEIRMNFFNYLYRYRLGVRSHPFISINFQLPS